MSSSRTIRRTVEYGVRPVSEASTSHSILAMREQRDHEKEELIRLNDRFASYLDRVKYLEASNRQLQATLDELRAKWGFDSDRLRQQYEPILKDARRSLDLATGDKAKAEIRSKRAEFDMINYKRLSDDLQQTSNTDKAKISALEATLRENQQELEYLHRMMGDSMSEIEKSRHEMKHLYEEISRLLLELDQETMARIQVENEKQTLEEQIPFLSAVHEQEMAEFRHLSSGHVAIDPNLFYKNELQRAIREIRNDFENLSRAQRSELEEFYRIKTEEVVQQADKQRREQEVTHQSGENLTVLRTSINEIKIEMTDLQRRHNEYLQRMSELESQLEALKRENGDVIDAREREILELRARLNNLMASYDEIVSNKTSLEFEINTYRRLLESEEAHVHRVSSSKITIVPPPEIRRPPPPVIPPPRIPPQEQNKINLTELQAKTTFQRSAKGPINIDECSPDGKFIQLANTSKNKDIDLTGWRLLRKVDNSPEITFTLPANFKLASGRIVRIWARGQSKDRQSNDLILTTHDSWGVGVSVVTRLLNDQNEEKATHIQKTVYAS